MSDSREVIWAGVGFFDENGPNPNAIESDEEVITDLVLGWQFSNDKVPYKSQEYRSGAELEEYQIPEVGTVVDIIGPEYLRIGFGVRVASEQEGRGKLPEIRNWLRGLGIVSPVMVGRWSPIEGILSDDHAISA